MFPPKKIVFEYRMVSLLDNYRMNVKNLKFTLPHLYKKIIARLMKIRYLIGTVQLY